jgi:hypothetical protein
VKKRIERLAESWTYIVVTDRALPPEDQTVFRLRPMSQAERLAAFDDASRTVVQLDGTQAVIGRERQVAHRICLTHIEEIRNFPASAAMPWPTNREARERYLELLDDDVIREVGNEIYDRSTAGVAEKNSSAPEPTSPSGADSAVTTSMTAPPA